MKFQFKIQQYQTDAVNSVVNIFDGQPYQERVRYVRDLGKQPKHSQLSFADMNFIDFSFGNTEDYAVGFENAEIAAVPAGTGNDFIKSFSEHDTFMNIEAQLCGTTEKFELIKFNGKYCLNVLNIGFDKFNKIITIVAQATNNSACS